MPSDYDTDVQTLENEVASLEERVKQLRQKYDTLYTRSLSSLGTEDVAPSANATRTARDSEEDSDDDPYGNLFGDGDNVMNELPVADIDAADAIEPPGLKALQLENAARLFGITCFATPDKKHIGLRFETFARGSFLAPHYVLLDRSRSGDDYVIFRHTIPVFIPLSRWIKESSTIATFAAKVKEALDQLVSRKISLEDNLGPLMKLADVDPACRMVHIKLGSRRVTLLLASEGRVERAVSMTNGKREFDIEKRLIGSLFRAANFIKRLHNRAH